MQRDIYLEAQMLTVVADMVQWEPHGLRSCLGWAALTKPHPAAPVGTASQLVERWSEEKLGDEVLEKTVSFLLGQRYYEHWEALKAKAGLGLENALLPGGYTVLMVSAAYDSMERVKALLEAPYHDTYLHQQSGSRMSALIAAAARGRAEVVKVLLEAGVNVNAQDKIGATALMRAAAEGSLDTVKVLVEAGAHVNLMDSWGRSALMKATAHLDCIQYLYACGADPLLSDRDGKTARMHTFCFIFEIVDYLRWAEAHPVLPLTALCLNVINLHQIPRNGLPSVLCEVPLLSPPEKEEEETEDY